MSPVCGKKTKNILKNTDRIAKWEMSEMFSFKGVTCRITHKMSHLKYTIVFLIVDFTGVHH